MKVFNYRFYLLILLSLFNLKSVSQDVNQSDSIRYSLVIYDGCEDMIKRTNEFTIEDRSTDSIIVYIPDTLGYCSIPKDTNNLYVLQATSINFFMSIDKSISVVTDTITIPPIHQAPIRGTGFYIGPTYYQYYNCGEPCDGFQQAYRPDGKLWQKGRFNNGKLKYLKTFYKDGSVESIIKKRFLNGCDKTYDITGNLTMTIGYFLFISHYRIYDKENEKYFGKYSFGRYK